MLLPYSAQFSRSNKFEVFVVLNNPQIFWSQKTLGPTKLIHFKRFTSLACQPLPTKQSACETRLESSLPAPKMLASNHGFYFKETSCVSLEWQGSLWVRYTIHEIIFVFNDSRNYSSSEILCYTVSKRYLKVDVES